MYRHTFLKFFTVAAIASLFLLGVSGINAQTDSLPAVAGGDPWIVSSMQGAALTRNLPAVRRGTLIMAGGEVINFRSLRFTADSVSFRIGKDPFRTEALDEILQVSRKRWQPAEGAAIMGVVGGLTGIILGTAIHLEGGDFWEFWLNIDDEYDVGFPRKGWPYLLVGTFGGAAFGALAGMLSNQEKVVYLKQDKPVEVFPEVGFLPGYGLFPEITCRIALHR